MGKIGFSHQWDNQLPPIAGEEGPGLGWAGGWHEQPRRQHRQAEDGKRPRTLTGTGMFGAVNFEGGSEGMRRLCLAEEPCQPTPRKRGGQSSTGAARQRARHTRPGPEDRSEA